MLDQRRAKRDGYITLREAAALCDYSPDYIGQLIRGGKIRGEQVYSNVAWVTTEAEICAYLDDKTRTVESTEDIKRVEAIGAQAFSYVLYAIIGLLVLALLVMQYIFYVSLDSAVTDRLLSAEVALNDN